MNIRNLYNSMDVEKNNWRSGWQKQWFLIKSQLATLRLDWKFSLLVVMVSPLSLLFFLYFLAGDNKEYMIYAITGNMVMSLVTGTMLSLGQELGILKEIRGFDYYALLPIRKINLVVAYVTKSTLITIPSMLVIFFVGKALLDLSINMNAAMVFVMLISGYSLSAVGAFIGTRSRDAEQANILTQIVQPIIVFCAPVFVPDIMLPKGLFYVSYFLPTKYVAAALRQGCYGNVDWLSIGILLVFCVVSIYFVEKLMDWRM